MYVDYLDFFYHCCAILCIFQKDPKKLVYPFTPPKHVSFKRITTPRQACCRLEDGSAKINLRFTCLPQIGDRPFTPFTPVCVISLNRNPTPDFMVATFYKRRFLSSADASRICFCSIASKSTTICWSDTLGLTVLCLVGVGHGCPKPAGGAPHIVP